MHTEIQNWGSFWWNNAHPKFQESQLIQKLKENTHTYKIISLTYNSQRKIQQDATVYQNLLFHIYEKLNMFRAKHRPSSGA